MAAIERDNPSLKGVLPKDFGRAGLDKQRLGQVINLVSDIALGSAADRAKDTLGRVYEYFLARFASAEGKSGGQFYTPSRVVRVLVEMLAPYKGRVYDPCCGSGGMFVSSEKFIEAHSGKLGGWRLFDGYRCGDAARAGVVRLRTRPLFERHVRRTYDRRFNRHEDATDKLGRHGAIHSGASTASDRTGIHEQSAGVRGAH